MPLSDTPLWQQVLRVFDKHGQPAPNWRLRDDLVGIAMDHAEAARAEERAKAEGEVEELRREIDDAHKAYDATDIPRSEEGAPWSLCGRMDILQRQWLAAVEAAESNLAKAEALNETLRREAEQWAMEARAHKASLHEAYRAVTGATGEPGNWNGAKPIIEAFAKAEARIADLKAGQEAELATARAANLILYGDPVAVAVYQTLRAERDAALSRATQAEELVREVVGAAEQVAADRSRESLAETVATLRSDWSHGYDAACRHHDKLLQPILAKLKAAPLQGGSSISASVESAARLASQVCDPTPPSSTGWRDIASAPQDEEANILASTTGKVWFQASWDPDDECWVTFNRYLESDQHPKLRGQRFEPRWWVPLPADHTADDRPTEGSGVLSLAPDSDLPSASGSEQQ